MSNHDDDHIDGGLEHDFPRVLSRRTALGGLFGGAGVVLLAACGSSTTSTAAATTTTPTAAATTAATTATTAAVTTEIPEETGGPYPADGSNGANVLSESGIVRSDITPSFAGSTGTAEGVPLTIKLKVLDVSAGGTGLAGAAVYLWHANRDGKYSLYSEGVTDQNYLRGVQAADADGNVTFTSIFPACYDGRWPHIHFEVYPSLADATSASNKMRTSQLALPKDTCATVYATSGYEQSVSNLSRVSLDSDMVFSDGYSLQLATMTGSNSAGWTATLNVPV